MLQIIAAVLTRWSTRWIPDAWIIAVVLTVVAFGLAFFLSPGAKPQDLPELGAARDLARALTLVYYWGKGFWVLLTFAMQMCLIIMTGYIVAVSPPFRRLLGWLAGRPKSPRGAIALMAFVSMALAFLNWGLSIVGAAVFARLMVKRQRGVDYRLLVAAAYLGMGTTWHSGLSASAPLLVATPGHFMENEIGVIDISRTIFHPFNLALVAIVVAFMTFFVPLLHPRKEDVVEADSGMAGEEDFSPPPRPAKPLPSERMEHSPVASIVIGVLFGAVFFILYFMWPPGGGGVTAQTVLGRINLDTVNFMFLTAGILLHKTPASFLKAAREAGESIWGVVIQFPFYAGIFGIIQFSGLQDVIAGWFLAVARKDTYPVIVYWYSGIVNYFVPSGGSKWAIEAPYIVTAGTKLGVPTPLTVLTYAWGDMMTDIIQPFWAIPLLSMARLNFRDIMGYCIIIFLVYLVITTAAFLVSPLCF